MNCDVAVIGAGAAGIAAALAAAESGADAVLVEQQGCTGGLATAAMVGTICGLYFRSYEKNPRFAVQGFARQFAEGIRMGSNTRVAHFAEGLHFLPYRPGVFHHHALQQLKQSSVQLLLNTTVNRVETVNKKIIALDIDSSNGIDCLHPNAVIDCTGNAQISTLSGLNRLEQKNAQTNAFVFQVSGLPGMECRVLALNLVRWIKKGINNGQLERRCERLSIIPGTINQGVGLLKLGLPQSTINSTEHRLDVRTLCLDIVDYLRQTDDLLKDLAITQFSEQIGIRSGFRSEGVKLLNQAHVLSCAKPDDGVAIGTWPIEYWNNQRKPEMSYFNLEDYYLIPAGALVSKTVANLFFAGNTISATEQAIASARVIGTCLSTGYAAGMLAAEFVNKGVWQSAIEKIRCKQVLSTKV